MAAPALDDRVVRAMATNPGGVVAPEDLVGRDDALVRLCRAVECGGAKVLGDRRFGKTSILAAVADELRAVGHTVVRVSAETDNPAQFGQYVLEAMRGEHVLRRALPTWQGELGGEVAVDVGVGSFKLTGKVSGAGGGSSDLDLFRSCARAVRKAGPYRVVFVFDEITVLAHHLAGDEPDRADEFFRTLRVPRQELGNLSIVLAGSVGLHHVLRDMAVVNDLGAVPIGPLAYDDAVHLACCLLRGAGIASARERQVAAAIADQCAAIPFYVHKLVEHLEGRGIVDPEPADLHAVVTGILEDPADEWELAHYDDRIDAYYGDDATLVRSMLDLYAFQADGLTVAQLEDGLAAVDLADRPCRDRLLGLLRRLEADHYLARSGEVDRMATSLLARAWKTIRRRS